MAYITIDEYIDIGTGGWHDATSYVVAKDPEFTKIIDQSIRDTINVKKWHTPLPKLPEDIVEGENHYYADLDELYAKVQIHVGESDSEWLVLEPKTQNKQQVIITEKGIKPIIVDSDDIDFH